MTIVEESCDDCGGVIVEESCDDTQSCKAKI